VLHLKTAAGEVIAPDSLREVRNEGFPVPGRPYEHGSLYIEFHVQFPERMDAGVLAALKGALPPGLPPPRAQDLQGDVQPADLLPADPKNISFDEGRGPNHNGQDGSDEEEGGGQPGVQCAQQ